MSFKHLEKSNTVLLRKFNHEFVLPSYVSASWIQQNKEHIREYTVLDLETTGLDCTSDLIIEIGLRKVKFDRRTGDQVSLGPTYTSLQDPKRELPQKITQLTGLDTLQLQNQEINWTQVAALLETTDLIIAHNARFDRSFLDPLLPISRTKIWACSSSQIDWLAKGFSSSKLELLQHYHGFYVDCHRAMNDVDGLSHLLNSTDTSTGKRYLYELLENAKQKQVRIIAASAPIENKELLKNRLYKWDNIARCWHKSILSEGVSEEIKWLEESVYKGPFLGKAEALKLCDNFKSRSFFS